jgi:hypothetical protein
MRRKAHRGSLASVVAFTGAIAAGLPLGVAACGGNAATGSGAEAGADALADRGDAGPNDANVADATEQTSPPVDAASDGPGADAGSDVAPDGPTPDPGDGGPGGGMCDVVTLAPDLLRAVHIPVGTDAIYDSNPPSSGSHYDIWAAYKEYASAVDRRYYVHDLEHGAIVFVYKCDDNASPACAAIVEGFRQVVAQITPDPACAAGGVAVRTVITPDPLLDVPVAAAAWGHVYRASCVDVPSLLAFAQAFHAKGPEEVCADGTTDFH